MSIGKRLREERELAGFSQEEFGNIGGVKVKSQGAYERGERFPDAKYLNNVSAHVDVQYIVTGQRSDIIKEVRESYRSGKPTTNGINPMLALKAVDLLSEFSNDYEINSKNRVGIYQMIYTALVVKELTGEDTDIRLMLDLMGKKK